MLLEHPHRFVGIKRSRDYDHRTFANVIALILDRHDSLCPLEPVGQERTRSNCGDYIKVALGCLHLQVPREVLPQLLPRRHDSPSIWDVFRLRLRLPIVWSPPAHVET